MDENMRRWLPWIAVAAVAVIVVIVILVVNSGGDDEAVDAETTTTAAAETTTTTEAETTTTTVAETTTTTEAETTTTTVAETTTTTEAPAGATIEATPVIAELQPYNERGTELFPAGSVQAHWYQWDGLYVVLYRGFDAADGSPICAGNSLQEASGFDFITNSPHNGTVDEICNGVPKLAEEPSGVFACGSLLYYLTEIPTANAGNLYGTLEIVEDAAAQEFYGQTSAVTSAIDSTPEFEPGLTAYVLPPSTVDDLTGVSCG